MADSNKWKQVGGQGSADRYFPGKSEDRKPGMYVTGIYQGTKENRRPDGTQERIYLLKGDKEVIGVNDHFMIADAFSQIKEGTEVRVTFDGKKKSTKTNREYNSFIVEVAAPEEAKEDAKADDADGIPF